MVVTTHDRRSLAHSAQQSNDQYSLKTNSKIEERGIWGVGQHGFHMHIRALPSSRNLANSRSHHRTRNILPPPTPRRRSPMDPRKSQVWPRASSEILPHARACLPTHALPPRSPPSTASTRSMPTRSPPHYPRLTRIARSPQGRNHGQAHACHDGGRRLRRGHVGGVSRAVGRRPACPAGVRSIAKLRRGRGRGAL